MHFILKNVFYLIKHNKKVYSGLNKVTFAEQSLSLPLFLPLHECIKNNADMLVRANTDPARSQDPRRVTGHS